MSAYRAPKPIPLELDRQLQVLTMVPHQTRSKKRKADALVPLPAPPFRVQTWNDLLALTRLCQVQKFKDCASLGPLLPVLEEIDNLVGLHQMKQAIVEKVVFYCQKDHFKVPVLNHMVLTGPSGCGKTTMAKALARLLFLMGAVPYEHIIEGNRSNMIGVFMGTTAKKTQKLINSALGGVLLIDEAYALGHHQNNDSYAKECVDTLNQNLTEQGDKFICIIIGYEESLRRDFFSMNPGLERRFTWRLTMDPHTPADLSEIFRRMVKADQLSLAQPELTGHTAWFQQHVKYFPHFGGSIRNLVEKVKTAHGLRVLGLPDREKSIITLEDFNVGFRMHKIHNLPDSKLHKPAPDGMYI